MVSAGHQHNAAIRIDGRLFTWGRNSSGQLGNGNTTNASSPVGIGTSSWIMASTGTGYFGATAAIRLGGNLFTWGSGYSGRPGDGSTSNRSSPVSIGSSSWTNVKLGGYSAFAILEE
jgi:alpha-tubulin suppressor-like RCC1 family protein